MIQGSNSVVQLCSQAFESENRQILTQQKDAEVCPYLRVFSLSMITFSMCSISSSARFDVECFAITIR